MPSVREIARRAGVSPATVSRYLNKQGNVRDETRERLESALKELGVTTPHKEPPFRVGVYLGDVTIRHNLYLTEVLEGITTELAANKGHIELLTPERVSRGLAQLHCDGILLVSPPRHSHLVDEVTKEGIPHVIISGRSEDDNAWWVDCDNEAGMKILAEYLFGLGHRYVAYLTAREAHWHPYHRLCGFKAAVREAGLDLPSWYIMNYQYTLPMTPTCMHETESLLRTEPRPTAIIVNDDTVIKGVYMAIERAGLRIPEDISVAGFGNQLVSEYISPPLTTIDQSQVEQGRRAAQLLLKQLRGKTNGEESRVLLQPRLIIRTSTAPPGKHSD